MPQTWDEHGNPVSAPSQAWDEHGNPIAASTGATQPTAQPTQAPPVNPAVQGAIDAAKGFVGPFGEAGGGMYDMAKSALAPLSDVAHGQFAQAGRDTLQNDVMGALSPTMTYLGARSQGQPAISAGAQAVGNVAGLPTQTIAQASQEHNVPKTAGAILGTLSLAALTAYMGGKLVPPEAAGLDPRVAAFENSWRFGGFKQLGDAVARVRAKALTNLGEINKADVAHGTPGAYAPEMTKLFDDLTSTMEGRDPVAMPKANAAKDELSAQAGKPMTFQEYANLRTRIGQLRAAAVENSPDWGVLNKLYNDMTTFGSKRASDLGMSNEWDNYNRLYRQYKLGTNEGPIGKALANDPNPMNMRDASAFDFWNSLHDPKMRSQANAALRDLNENFDLPDSFLKLNKSLMDISDMMKNKGMWNNWRSRLGVASVFSMIGVPHPFLSAYGAMMIPEILKAHAAESAAGDIANATSGTQAPGSYFGGEKPPSAPSSAQGPQTTSGGSVPPDLRSGAMSKVNIDDKMRMTAAQELFNKDYDELTPAQQKQADAAIGPIYARPGGADLTRTRTQDMPRSGEAKTPGMPVSALDDDELESIAELKQALEARGITHISKADALKLFETPADKAAQVKAARKAK